MNATDFQEQSEDSDQELQENLEELNKQLIKSSASGSLEEVASLLKQKANINTQDRKGWTPLIWASSQGKTEVARYLIDHGSSLTIVPDNLDKSLPQYFISPLHWATFNGHIETIWILIKKGLNCNELDRYGNNCIHHAVASSRVDIIETFLAFGVAADHKNTRGHLPVQLTSDMYIKKILNTAILAKKCVRCRSMFDLRNTRHLCQVCKNYFCSNCKETNWMFISPKSLEEDKPVCRCLDCQAQINKAELDMQEKIEMNLFGDLDGALKLVQDQGVVVDPKLLEKAQNEHERLEHEGKIERFIESLSYVPNYKTIQKSVYTLRNMLHECTSNEINIEERIVEKANKEIDRLISERNLRYQVDITNPGEANSQTVRILEELATNAENLGVANEYIDCTRVIVQKMKENIEAHYILRLFLDYPIREYPEPVLVDSRGRKIPPKTPPAPKEEAKKTVKKKKEPKFIIPDWATELPALVNQVNSLDNLVKKAVHLELSNDFLDQAKENMIRMKKEIKFRQQLEEEARLLAEKKAAERKKNKNK